MAWTDVVGVVGVIMILAAYAAATMGRLDVKGALSLSANAIGATLILLSLSVDFNLSAAIVEGVWALVALVGLVRLGVRRLRAGPRQAS